MMWKTSTIDEICNIEYGTRVVRRKDSGTVYPVYGGGGETFLIDKTNRQDRVVISRFAMSEQCTRFVKGKFFLNDSGLTLSPKTKDLSQVFLDKTILSLNSTIYQLGRGMAQRNLSMKNFRLLKITYPTSIEKQQQIVAKLDTAFAEIDKSISLNKKKLEGSATVISKILPDLFDRYVSKFIDSPLGSLFKVSSGKFLPKKKMNSEGNIKVYGGNGISGSHDDFNLDGKNILIGRVGAYCGNVHYVNEKIWLTDNAMYTHSYKYNFNLKFLSLILSSINMGSFARHAAQPVISFSSIKDLKIRFPESVDEQSQIVNAFEKIENNLRKLRINYKKQKQNFEVLKSSILSQEIKNKVA